MNWQFYEAQLEHDAVEATAICGRCHEVGHNFDRCPDWFRDRLLHAEAAIALLQKKLPDRWDWAISGLGWFVAGVMAVYLGEVLR